MIRSDVLFVAQMLTQAIPPTGPLLSQMPSGREIHSIKPFQPPMLGADVLEAMRSPLERSDEVDNYPSSDDETAVDPSPVVELSKSSDYRTGTPNYF